MSILLSLSHLSEISKFRYFHSTKIIWKYRLWNGRHFASASKLLTLQENFLYWFGPLTWYFVHVFLDWLRILSCYILSLLCSKHCFLYSQSPLHCQCNLKVIFGGIYFKIHWCVAICGVNLKFCSLIGGINETSAVLGVCTLGKWNETARLGFNTYHLHYLQTHFFSHWAWSHEKMSATTTKKLIDCQPAKLSQA